MTDFTPKTAAESLNESADAFKRGVRDLATAFLWLGGFALAWLWALVVLALIFLLPFVLLAWIFGG